MPQLTYSQNAIAAQPGMAYDAEASERDVVSFVAGANIPFGVLCEFNAAGTAVQPVQGVAAGNLAGTVTVTNGSASITFSGAQTLPAGQALFFSGVGIGSQNKMYYLAAAVAASTAGTLTEVYTGATSSTGTTEVVFQPNLVGVSLFDPLGVEQTYQTFQVPTSTTGSSAVGWLKGQLVPFMRRGRIWVAGDAGGTPLPANTGPINVWHSSTGANPQGVFTFTAGAVTAGGEIDRAPGCLFWSPGVAGVAYAATYTDPFGNVFKVYPVEVNVTAAKS